MDADDSEVSEDMAEVLADYSDAEPETEEPDSQEFYASGRMLIKKRGNCVWHIGDGAG